MKGQAGLWNVDERYARLSAAGDPLERLNTVVAWEMFRKPLAKALNRPDQSQGGRPPYDAVMRGYPLKTFFQKLTDMSSVARTEQMLKEGLAELVQELGFDCYAFVNLQPVRTYAVSNYPPEWQARYLAQNYIKVDPIVSMAQARMQAFAWAAERPRQSTDKLVRRFYREAGDFGIRSGVTIPIRTAFGHMSMLTLASHKPTLSLEKDIDQIAAITAVAQLHAKLEQQDVEPTASVHVDLKAKQALCLKWSAEGKTMKDIAAIENISFATVTFHLNNARKALDVGTLPHATALATKLKLI